MRLLNVHTKRITEFLDEERPPYAILSHTWGKSEITPQDLEKLYGNEARESVEPNESVIDSGYAKIKGSCAQALKDDLEWVWIDTCCIDKANSAELSEAINSMFRWYNEAMICYVYLSDVSGIDIAIPDSSFCQSRWFTRGWTLQELLAPTRVHFYENSWDFLGTRDSLCDALQFATGIPEDVLKGDQLRETSIAQRMSWASKRNTSRREDMAYCLLGIFDVNMPLLYGEGDKAFLRLQEEVAKGSRDDSLFAWGINQSSLHGNSDDFGILARSPHDFAGCGKVVQCQIVPQYGFLNTGGHTGFELAKQGVRMSIPVSEVQTTNTNQKRLYVGVLNCRLASTHDENHLLGIPLVPAALVNPLAHLTKDSVSMERPRFLATIPFEEARIRNITTIFVGSASGVTYKTDPKSAIIQYDSSVVPAEIRLFVRYSTLIIPPPRGFFRWHPTLLP